MCKTNVVLEVIRQTVGRDRLELGFLLGYLANRNHIGKPTRFVDLVYAEEFGNGSVVSQNLQTLSGQKLILFTSNNSVPWEKTISVTEIGLEWLQSIETDILSVVTTLDSKRAHQESGANNHYNATQSCGHGCEWH